MTEKDKKLVKQLNLMKFDADGNEIPYSEEEAEWVMKSLRDILRGQGQVVFSDEALAQLKAKGLSEDGITAMMADAVKAKH